MVIIAIPFLSMRLGSADAGTDPPSTTTRKAYDLLAKGFGPGYNGPLQLVAQINTPGQLAAFKADRGGRGRDARAWSPPPGGGARARPRTPDGGHRQRLPGGLAAGASTSDLLNRVRNQVIPAATTGTGLTVLVGGTTAIFEDFSHILSAKLPLFIGIVVLLSFLLLMAVFRSL